MAELTPNEIWFIKVCFKNRRGLSGSHRITDIQTDMQYILRGDSLPTLHTLIKKKVLNLSPDERQVKFTDYGIELYKAMEREQEDWEKQSIIKISNLDREEILIRAGETFRANRVLREILQKVRLELHVIDPYLGPD